MRHPPRALKLNGSSVPFDSHSFNVQAPNSLSLPKLHDHLGHPRSIPRAAQGSHSLLLPGFPCSSSSGPRPPPLPPGRFHQPAPTALRAARPRALTARRAASRRTRPPPAGTPRGCAGPAGSRSRRLAPRGRPSSRSGAARSARSTASPTAGPGLPPPLSPSYAHPAATAATASAAATANRTRGEAAPGRGRTGGRPLPAPSCPRHVSVRLL